MTKAVEELVSYHAFLFPFKWKFLADEGARFEDKTNLKRLNVVLSRYRTTWERRSSWLDPTTLAQYNEATYFYDFVRPALYDSGQPDSLLSHYYYVKPVVGDFDYVIELSNGKEYRLEIDDIVVSFFSTGVGLLAFHLYNRSASQTDPEDIIAINQYGRRLYPPYLGITAELVGSQAFFEYEDWTSGLDSVKHSELAQSIRLEAGGEILVVEDFTDWAKPPKLDQETRLIRHLLPPALTREVKLTPVIDDRMFVVCWYGNDRVAEKLKNSGKWLESDWWYRYVFVDGRGRTCQNQSMQAHLMKEHTYTRWSDYDTFYGVSRYSMVCLTKTFRTESFSRILCSHIQTVYYKIALLALVQRASVMRFSDEVTAISRLSESDRQIGPKVSSLYRQYLRFINKIYFREITPQEQGIEIYGLLQQHMRLETHTQELETEVQELHQYVTFLEGERRNTNLDLLTYLGALLLVPSFLASFLGMEESLIKDDWLIISIYCFVSAFLALAVVRAKGRWRWFFVGLMIVLLMLFLFGFVSNWSRS